MKVPKGSAFFLLTKQSFEMVLVNNLKIAPCRGVSWHDRSQRWEVRVWGNGKQHFIGSFEREAEAAKEYDKAVLRIRGQDHRTK